MSKQSFLNELKKRLSPLSKKEILEHLNFYNEMIDDMVEEGIGEEEAVLRIGSAEEIALQILSERDGEKCCGTSTKKYTGGEITLLILGSPLWVTLAISALAVVFSLYVVLWSCVISLWAVFLSIAACAPVGVIGGIIYTFGELRVTGFALIGIGVFFVGLSILLFDACKAAMRGAVILTANAGQKIKKCFGKKREA